MPTYANMEILPPQGWEEFENIVFSVAHIKWRNSDFTIHATQGQEQDGVDIYGYNEQGSLIGLQCKKTTKTISKPAIQQEIKKAERFKHGPIEKLYIATTMKTDKRLQEVVREISQKRKQNSKFTVSILFWKDICLSLTSDVKVLLQHYPQLKVKVKEIGISHDKKLFKKFQKDFPYDPSAHLLGEHNFRYKFPRKSLDGLFKFVDEWMRPDYKFVNKNIQKKLESLYDSASHVSDLICENITSVGDQKLSSIFSETHKENHKEEIKMAKVINIEARKFYVEYADFINAGKAKYED